MVEKGLLTSHSTIVFEWVQLLVTIYYRKNVFRVLFLYADNLSLNLYCSIEGFYANSVFNNSCVTVSSQLGLSIDINTIPQNATYGYEFVFFQQNIHHLYFCDCHLCDPAIQESRCRYLAKIMNQLSIGVSRKEWRLRSEEKVLCTRSVVGFGLKRRPLRQNTLIKLTVFWLLRSPFIDDIQSYRKQILFHFHIL